MKLRRFFGELKRRNVYRVAVGYPVVVWLLIQIITQVFPFFEVPDWAIRILILVLVIAYPVALVLAWAFDITPRGIERTADAPAQPERSRRAAIAAPHKSIAVLPFKNLSDDQQNSYFTDGVQDEILTALARIADLKVISRTSVMQYRSVTARDSQEIGRELGAAHLLQGSVQRERGKVRVIAQLIDARTDSQLWAEHYDRDLADVFAIQSEIAQAIAAQLQAKLSPGEKAAIETPPTTDVAAYDLYVRAKAISATTTFSLRARDTFLEAIKLLEQAIARDPSFLLAHCKLASVNDRLYNNGFDRTPERLQRADAAVAKAMRLAPHTGEAHLARGEHLYRGFLDYDGARAELAIAQRSLPNSSEVPEIAGYIARRQGRWEESISSLRRALELDPRNYFILQQIALTYRKLRRYEESIAALDRALEIIPTDVATRVERGSVELDWRADTLPLRETIASILAANPSAASELADAWITLALCERDATAAERALVALGDKNVVQDAILLSRAFNEGLVARMSNNEPVARRAFTAARQTQQQRVDTQPDYAPALCVLGFIDAGLGRTQDALLAGRRAVELLPPTKDALNGPTLIEHLAAIAAWCGEKDFALEQLRLAATLPSYLSYGKLKLHPLWDPLRGDARFDDIVASLAPQSG